MRVYKPKAVKLIEEMADMEVNEIDAIILVGSSKNIHTFFQESLTKMKEEFIKNSLVSINKIYRKKYGNLAMGKKEI